jgi:hypothetical protein
MMNINATAGIISKPKKPRQRALILERNSLGLKSFAIIMLNIPG